MTSGARGAALTRRAAVQLGSGGIAGLLASGGVRRTGAQKASTSEANKAIVLRLFEEIVHGTDESAIGMLYAPDHVDRGAWARQMPGPAGMPLPLQTFRGRFPGVTVMVEELIAEGDLVAAVATWSSAHPPAGTHVVGRTMHVFRLADGQIVEGWSQGWEWLARLTYRRKPSRVNPLVMP